jgi:hypothetical protein
MVLESSVNGCYCSAVVEEERTTRREHIMSQGYPSRKRVRKAFERGVKTARTGRGFNPYKNPILKDLYERGKNRTPKLAEGAPGTAVASRPPPTAQARPHGNLRSSGPSQPQRNNPFDPPRRMGRRPQ